MREIKTYISDDSISGFQFQYDVDLILYKISQYGYQYFKYVNLIWAQEKDANIKQDNIQNITIFEKYCNI